MLRMCGGVTGFSYGTPAFQSKHDISSQKILMDYGKGGSALHACMHVTNRHPIVFERDVHSIINAGLSF